MELDAYEEFNDNDEFDIGRLYYFNEDSDSDSSDNGTFAIDYYEVKKINKTWNFLNESTTF